MNRFLAIIFTFVVTASSVQGAAPKPDANLPMDDTVAPTSPPTASVASVPTFSWSHFAIDALVGGVVGGAAAYGTYRGLCAGGSCAGASLAGFGVNVVLTPLAVYAVGSLLGGHGKLSTTYYAGLIGLTAAGAGYAAGPGAGLAIGMMLMPFTAAVGYEGSSVRNANTLSAQTDPTTTLLPSIAPILTRDGLCGASAGIAGSF